MVFKNGVKTIQAASYNGARTVGCGNLGFLVSELVAESGEYDVSQEKLTHS